MSEVSQDQNNLFLIQNQVGISEVLLTRWMQPAPAREALWLPFSFQLVWWWLLQSCGPLRASVTVTAVHLQDFTSTQHTDKLREGTSRRQNLKQAL